MEELRVEELRVEELRVVEQVFVMTHVSMPMTMFVMMVVRVLILMIVTLGQIVQIVESVIHVKKHAHHGIHQLIPTMVFAKMEDLILTIQRVIEEQIVWIVAPINTIKRNKRQNITAFKHPNYSDLITTMRRNNLNKIRMMLRLVTVHQ